MQHFLVGARVIKAHRYSMEKYCSYGGAENSVPLGTLGTVESITKRYISVRFDNGVQWRVDLIELELMDYPKKEVKVTQFADIREFLAKKNSGAPVVAKPSTKINEKHEFEVGERVYLIEYDSHSDYAAHRDELATIVSRIHPSSFFQFRIVWEDNTTSCVLHDNMRLWLR